MSFFRNVFSTGTSKSTHSDTDANQTPQIDSMFAGLNLKPRLPDPEPDQIENQPDSQQQSAFSFVQAPSSFSFIAEQPLERAKSELMPESGSNGEGINQSINKRRASVPTQSSHLNHIEGHSLNNGNLESEPTLQYTALPANVEYESIPLSKENEIREIISNEHEIGGQWHSQLNRFASILSIRMMQHWNMMNQLDESHSSFEKQCTEVLQSLSEANGDVEALKIAQSRAVEDEAYDRADELDGKIQLLQSNILEIEKRFKIATDGKMGISEQRRQQIDQLQAALETTFSELIELKESCRTESQETIDMKMSQLNDKQEHLKEESLRIDKILGIIDAELDRIQNEDEEVRCAISERTKDVQQDKDSTFSELKSIDEELVRLREQIRLKEEEQARLREALSEVDQKISQAGAAFDRQLMRIENQRLRIEADRADILKDQDELRQTEMELNSERDMIDALMQSSTELATSVDEIVTARKRQMEKIMQSGNLYAELHERRRDCEQALSQAQLRLAEQDRKSGLLSKQKVSLEESIKKQESLLEEIDQQVPELEVNKANAVSSRDFKSAGILAKQLKQLTSLRADSIELIDKLKKDLHAVSQSIMGHEAPLREARLHFESAELELDRLDFEHLCKQLSSLKSIEDGADNDELALIKALICKLTSSAEILSEKHGWAISSFTIDSPTNSPVRSPELRRSPSPSACSELHRSPSPSACSELHQNPSPSACSSPQQSSRTSPSHAISNGDQAPEVSPSQRLTDINIAIDSLEQQLDKAIGSDDFDEADKIQSNIDVLNLEKDVILRTLPIQEDSNLSSQEVNEECCDDRPSSVSPERQPRSDFTDIKDRAELPGQLVDE